MFFLTTHQARLALAIILIAFVGLCVFGIGTMGIVGEVAWTWMAAEPSSNLAIPLTHTEWGPLAAHSTRPMATLSIGNFKLPLAVNLYTGGLADWPARILSVFGFRATTVLHVLAGALLIALVHRFLRIHASTIAACSASLLLATDWTFVFFRRALGGTELLLRGRREAIHLWLAFSGAAPAGGPQRASEREERAPEEELPFLGGDPRHRQSGVQVPLVLARVRGEGQAGTPAGRPAIRGPI